MNGKSPISLLQELMAAKKAALPKYIEENFGSKFKCTVFAGGVVGVGVDATKKAAKHQSAANALQQLTVQSSPQVVSIKGTSVIQKPIKNYVGDLNEFSSKSGRSYPVYDTIINTGPLGSEYFVKCSFDNKQTVGRGVHKKDAKQDSARKMLQLIEKSTTVYTIVHSKNTVEVDNVKEIIALYDSLSVYQQPKDSVTPVEQEIVKSLPKIKTVDEEDVDVLKTKLKELGIEYSINDFQTEPEIIVSLVVTGTNFTFLETGKSKEEAVKKVLQKVLQVKKNGCSFNTDLISL